MLVDSHCHLDLIKNSNPDEVIAVAQAEGIDYCLWVSIDLERFPTMLAMAEGLDPVFTSVGIHPNSTLQHEVDVSTLTLLADNPTVVAIGETGLDYFRHQENANEQQARFRTHIRAAKGVGKPLIIHMREATADTLRILHEENAAEVGGVMHCFSEGWDTAQQAMDMGFYISFSGIVTFKQAKRLQAIAKQLPLERMLVETDSPYLAPVPYRGRVNQPAYVRHVAQCIADLRMEDLEVIAEATTHNFFQLFKGAIPRLN